MYAHLSVYGDSLETSPLVPRQREIRLAKGVVQDSLQRSTPPYKVYNHLTLKDNELFQTPWPECRLILRDHAGKTLWEKKMEGNIQDRVEQIDFLKNNKLQTPLGTAVSSGQAGPTFPLIQGLIRLFLCPLC